MNNPNRYEEVPQKENKFAKGLKAFGRYLKFVFVDFFNSFKYNNMKLAAILFALPGILLGFFMFAHVPTIRHVTVSYVRSVEGSNVSIVPTLNADSTDPTDFKLTLGEYDGYKNIVLVKDSYDTEAEGFNQDTTPIDGFAKSDNQTTQLSQPEATLTQLDKDSYGISISGLDDTEKTNVKYYSVFIYEVVDEHNYFFTYSTYSEGQANVNITRLTAGTSYTVAVKAIAADNSVYYSSKLSENSAFVVETSGSSASSQDYDEANSKYIKYQGEYSVDTVNGAAATGDIKDLKLVVKANGDVVYTYAGNTVNARLTTAGEGLVSNAQETVNILPFDFSAIAIFVLTLFGFLNVFLSLELSKKKNLGSVIKAALTTVVIVGLGALYIYAIIATDNALQLENGLKLGGVTTMFDTNCIISIVTVSAAAFFSLAGLILAFINYDRTYEKVDR